MSSPVKPAKLKNCETANELLNYMKPDNIKIDTKSGGRSYIVKVGEQGETETWHLKDFVKQLEKVVSKSTNPKGADKQLIKQIMKRINKLDIDGDKEIKGLGSKISTAFRSFFGNLGYIKSSHLNDIRKQLGFNKEDVKYVEGEVEEVEGEVEEVEGELEEMEISDRFEGDDDDKSSTKEISETKTNISSTKIDNFSPDELINKISEAMRNPHVSNLAEQVAIAFDEFMQKTLERSNKLSSTDQNLSEEKKVFSQRKEQFRNELESIETNIKNTTFKEEGKDIDKTIEAFFNLVGAFLVGAFAKKANGNIISLNNLYEASPNVYKVLICMNELKDPGALNEIANDPFKESYKKFLQVIDKFKL
jgi:hypothetical protein